MPLGSPLPPHSKLHSVIDHIFSKRYSRALKQLSSLPPTPLTAALKLYLFYGLKLHHLFIAQWIEAASEPSFLKTKFAFALEHLAGPSLMEAFHHSPPYLSLRSKAKLNKISGKRSPFTLFLKAHAAPEEEAVRWIPHLPLHSPQRRLLAYKAIYAYAKKGSLGASGRLLKEVVAPTLTEDEQWAYFHLTLARLLYQARAFDQAVHYYALIPESSSYFFKAKTEALWIKLRKRDFSQIKGDLATLELDAFKGHFAPDLSITRALTALLLCQYGEARQSIDQFIHIHRPWIKAIERELRSPSPKDLGPHDFALKNLNDGIKRLERERSSIALTQERDFLDSLKKEAQRERIERIKLKWKNQKKILESSIRKISFVRIELLARLRLLADKEAKKPWMDRDTRRVYTSEVAKNQLKFPRIGPLWGDELL